MIHRPHLMDTVELTVPQDGFPAGSIGQVVEFGSDDDVLVGMQDDSRDFALDRIDSLIWVPVSNLRSVE